MFERKKYSAFIHAKRFCVKGGGEEVGWRMCDRRHFTTQLNLVAFHDTVKPSEKFEQAQESLRDYVTWVHNHMENTKKILTLHQEKMQNNDVGGINDVENTHNDFSDSIFLLVRMYSVSLLYWYKSTNTNAAAPTSKSSLALARRNSFT